LKHRPGDRGRNPAQQILEDLQRIRGCVPVDDKLDWRRKQRRSRFDDRGRVNRDFYAGGSLEELSHLRGPNSVWQGTDER
jgi:hypothetical protein